MEVRSGQPKEAEAEIYARYSPRIEQDQSFTIENQIAMCRELAAKDEVVIDEDHIYQDHHISGASDNRPQFEQMLEHIWSGHFPDYLYTKDASRLSRKGLEASWLIEKIWDRGITIRYCLGDYGDPRQSRHRIDAQHQPCLQSTRTI